MNDASVNQEEQAQIDQFNMQYNGNNVSAFYQDELNENSDNSFDEEEKKECSIESQPLRLPNGGNQNSSDLRAKETEAHPIKHMMQMHQQLSGQKQKNSLQQ
jgi:hypothetical protein